MNKHIELVKEWLANNDSVSLEELEANEKAAEAAYYAAYNAYAAYAVDDAYAASAKYWVRQYEELTNELL